jgi:hypothetical protein
MEKIIMELKKKVESYVLPEGVDLIPPYSSIKLSKEELYTKFSEIVVKYNRICDSLSKLQYTSVTIDRLLREIPNTKEVFSKQKMVSIELKNLKEDVVGLLASHKFLKDGLEAQVKFYNSVQFIINSYRMSEV